MKKLLLLLLLSFILCEKIGSFSKPSSIIDSFICVLKSDTFFNEITKLIETIKTKDLLKIINTGYLLFQDLKEEFNRCSKTIDKVDNEDNEDDYDDINLGYPRVVLTLYTIIGENAFNWYDQGGLKLLKSNCYKYYGQTQWFCTYIRKQD